MKAIDLIQAMVSDSDIAAHGGTMYFDYEDGGPVKWAKNKFGAKIVWDNGVYCGFHHFYLYGVDIDQSDLQGFLEKHQPDAKFKDFNEQDIYLWRIE